MGHSQSYDLRNPEKDEKTHDTVRGVRRVSRDQTNANFSTENTDPFDMREEELRDRIRREQLREREVELESLRIRQHESREPIIDAYRQSSPPRTLVYNEFNNYDSMKHSPPLQNESSNHFKLQPVAEVNEGRRISLQKEYSQVPVDPSPQVPRHQLPETEVPRRTDPLPEYPQRSSVFSGRLSPLPRHPEVDPHPMPRYIPPMSSSIPIPESPTHTSEIHAEKRMVVGIDDSEKAPGNITYVTVATSAIDNSSEPLHRHPEVGRHPVQVAPKQWSYEASPLRQQKQAQNSRRPSEESTKILVTPQKNCDIENCTHVEVNDSPMAPRRRISQDSQNKSRLNIFVDENNLEEIVDHDEKLYYTSYLPTISLGRRPIVSFYDKLH